MSNDNDERYLVLSSIIDRLENLEKEVKRLKKNDRRIIRKLNAKKKRSDKKRKDRKHNGKQRKHKEKIQTQSL